MVECPRGKQESYRRMHPTFAGPQAGWHRDGYKSAERRFSVRHFGGRNQIPSSGRSALSSRLLTTQECKRRNPQSRSAQSCRSLYSLLYSTVQGPSHHSQGLRIGTTMSGLRTRCLGFGLLLSCLVMLVACGGPAHSILISPSAVLLAPAQTFQFNIARVGDAATSGPLPVLTVNGIAGGTPSTGTIAPDGTYTAPSSASSQAI